MKKVLRGWKRYLCFYLTMVMLTTSLGGCLFSKEQQPEQVTGSQVESESGNSVEKPTGGNTEESGQEATEESDQESKPSEEESKPSEEESKSSEEQSKPSEEQNKPSREENKPSQEESKPSQEQSKPSEESGAPSQEPSKPSEVPSKPADTTAPTAEIQIGTNKWNKFWNTVTFGIFCKDTKQVTITAADNVTAKPTIKYYLSDKELTEAEAKADGIIWTAYESAFDISPNSKQIVYAKVTDEAGNLVIVNSEGIVVYTDTVASVTDITYVKNVSGDVTVDVTLNGNTVAEIKNGTDILTSGTDYTVDAEGTICLKEAYLKTLAVGAYTLTVSYNPMGEVYQSESGNDEPAVTVMTLTVREPKLVSITQPDAITGVENGTDKTAAALGLPETVTIVTEDTSVTTAAVTWDLTELAEGSYDPSVQKGQTFTVKGTVALPEGISNAGNVGLEVTIQVTVSAIRSVGVPEANLAEGNYVSNQLVELSCSTAGADIYYTTDNTTPSSTNGTKYTGPISVVGTEGVESATTIKAIAVKNGMGDSSVATFTYTISIPDTTAPTAEIQIETNKWNKFWNTVTFGKFFKDTKQVTITATDNVTEAPVIKYYLSDKELTEIEAKADSITWTAYENAFSIAPNSKQIVYAKVTDEAGNLVIVNSEGIVVYTDTVASVTDITYVKNVSGNVTVDVTLNGNTVAAIKNGTDILTSGTDYTVDAEGTICLKEAYLRTLGVGAYTLTVSYHPMGEVYQSESGNDEPAVTVLTLTVREPKLVSIKQPGAITGVENGTDKTAAALGLPGTVTIVTEDTSVTTASVTWDLTELAEGSYDPSVQKEQTFTVKGTVALPEGISNADSINREVTIQVTVSAVVVDDTESYTVSLYHADTCLKTATKQAGTNLADISAPYVDGSIFLGWYYDKGQTQKVDPEDVLVKDVALYGKYGESVPLPESGSPNYLGETDVAPDFEIFVNANSTTASASDVREALKLSNLTAPSRTDESDAFEKDELIVTALGGGKFSVKAKDGYQEGATYELAIAGSAKVPGLVFEGQTTDVVYYNFTVKKEEVMNLSLDGDVIYLSVSELSKEDAEKILAYSGLYQAVLDPETNETSYQPTNTFGTFTYSEREFVAGDIIAVYEGTRPDLRGLDSSLNEGIAYIEITKAEGSNYEYKSADSSDVLFTPDIIPIDIDESDGVTGWTEAGTSFTIVSSLLDFTTGYEKVNLDFETVVEPGDFVAFYTGDFGAENAAVKGYGKIISVTETGTFTEIHYSVATESEVLASMDIFNQSDLSDEQHDSIDDQMLVASITDQVLESGFAQEAGMYLASMAVETDEVKELLGDTNLEFKDCIITYSDGTPVPTDEMMLMANVLTGGGNGTPEISVNISKGLSHFSSGKGFQVELALKYGFDLKKSGSNSKIHIEMTAIFQTEVMIKFSASGGAVWETAWIFPYIADYEMSGNIDQGLYTNIAITATAQLEENEFEGPDQMLQPEDTTSGNSNAQQIIDLSESIRNMMEECKQQSSENEDSGFDGLTDKYQRFIEQASDNWVELVCVPLFSSEGTLDPFYITAYSVSIDFVISATMSVSIGMSFQYEKCQRHSFTLLLFHTRDSSSKTVDISPERYQFDFYVMGTLGVRAGIRAKVMFGVFSVKLAGIGIKLEAGAYARLWGYFYYCLSWEKGKGKESSSMGALYIEIGVYLKINLALEVLNGTFSYCPTLYEGEWPIWSAGTQKHVMSYQYDDTGYFHGSIPGAGDDHYIPLSYDMLREKTIVVPAEVFRMYYMDLKNGATNHALYDSVKRCSSDKTSSAYDDEENFFVEISEPFSYDPTTNTISVNPEEGRYSYEGTVTFTWKQQDITFNTKPITRTFDVSWIDPDHGYLLAFDTKGGTLIRTKVYDAGKEVEAVEDPTKIGYAFAGWYSDEEYTKSASVPTIMPEGNVTLYAKWVPVPNQYYVRHAYESLYDGYVFEKEVIQKDIYTDDPAKTMRVYTDDVLDQERIIAD
ncbi:MAG: InlB B-repeat-containing protein, partial [Acetatifactor sp.]|nr:InlB B-repeat-containing protein [Acetatifactor sp.]